MLWLLILFAAIIVVSYLCYWVAFYNPVSRHMEPVEHSKGVQYRKYLPRLTELSRYLERIPCEIVSITARDGKTLAARYYHLRDHAPLIIQFHGYRGSGIRDFCGGCIIAMELGYNVLLVDQRAHGKSSGHTITFGIRDRLDCVDWIHWGMERLRADVPIFLYGISMGASTVLMAAGEDLPANVRGIIADCPYSSPYDIIRKVCKDQKYPPALTMPFIQAAARLFGNFSLTECTAAEAVKRTNIPILMIHGEDDRFVPCAMSAEIQGPSVRRHTFPEAGHGISYMKDTPRYHRLVKEFLKEIMA